MLYNDLHIFLLNEGVPQESLPKVIVIPKQHLVPMMEGYAKENKTKEFYICVCNSGHDVCCKNWSWTFSGWSIRVEGRKVLFLKGDWEFNISQIPIFQNVLFIVSKRTKQNELAQFRGDMICFSSSRKKLMRKTRNNETQRKNYH
jgi:hypothetical protein